MFVLLMLPLAVVVGIGSMSRWKRDQLRRFNPMILLFLVSSLILSAVITYMLTIDTFSFGGFAGLSLAIWVMFWSVFSIFERLKNHSSLLVGLRKTPASIWGMAVAHFGIAIFVLGVTHVNTYSIEKDIRMAPGETYQLGRYQFTFEGVTQVEEFNYRAQQGEFVVETDSDKIITLKPQKRFYSSSNPMTEAAINTNLGRDLYVSLGEDLGEGAWSVRLYLKSFVACIWLGGMFMALGGLIAITDRRFRKPVQQKAKVTQSPPAQEQAT
jgi:cytochrome c-type biogenesis protein CcmF